MGLFYHRCKDRYIRRCKDWIEHPRPWMHREFNIPPSCNCGPAPTEHTSVLIPILILLLLGLATAYVYKVRKHSSPKMLTLYIPPHKIPYELSISNELPLDVRITKMLTGDAPLPLHPLYASPLRWVLYNTSTKKMVHPSTVNDTSDGGVYLCVSSKGAERFAKSEVGTEIREWIDEVAGEEVFTPTGSMSGYTSGYEYNGE